MSEARRTALTEIALASRSPRRKALLEGLGLHVVIVPSVYDEETATSNRDPAELAQRHALGKARHADAGGPPVLVAADTIVAVDGELLGKPRDGDDARRMLRKLAGREHRVFTGFAVLDRAAGTKALGVESAEVRFARLDDKDISAYVASGEPMGKAGAYGIQGLGALLVTSICGDFYTVMGLPLARIDAALRELGYDVRAR
jgi:septum formation protein